MPKTKNKRYDSYTLTVKHIIFTYLNFIFTCCKNKLHDVLALCYIRRFCGSQCTFVCVFSMFLENPLAVELAGDVGYCNLLVRAVRFNDEDGDGGGPLWSYVAQELRCANDIDGSLIQMMLTHRLPVDFCSTDESATLQKLLQQFPSVLPASLPQFLANPSVYAASHGELTPVDMQTVLSRPVV